MPLTLGLTGNLPDTVRLGGRGASVLLLPLFLGRQPILSTRSLGGTNVVPCRSASRRCCSRNAWSLRKFFNWVQICRDSSTWAPLREVPFMFDNRTSRGGNSSGFPPNFTLVRRAISPKQTGKRLILFPSNARNMRESIFLILSGMTAMSLKLRSRIWRFFKAMI